MKARDETHEPETDVAIMGYGIASPKFRGAEEWDGWQTWARSVNQYLSALVASRPVRVLNFTGGFTGPKDSVSEARSTFRYFVDVLNLDLSVYRGEPYLSEVGYNTAANIWDAAQRSRRRCFFDTDSPRRLIVICDEVRTPTVRAISKRISSVLKVPIEVVGFPRPDPHPNSRPEAQKLKTWLYQQLLISSFLLSWELRSSKAKEEAHWR